MKQSLLIWIPSVSSRPCHIDYSFEYIFLLTCAALIADTPILSSSLLLREIYALCHYFGKENASYDIFGAHENSILSVMLSCAKIKLFLVLGAPLRALRLWISKQSTALTNIIKYHNLWHSLNCLTTNSNCSTGEKISETLFFQRRGNLKLEHYYLNGIPHLHQHICGMSLNVAKPKVKATCKATGSWSLFMNIN